MRAEVDVVDLLRSNPNYILMSREIYSSDLFKQTCRVPLFFSHNHQRILVCSVHRTSQSSTSEAMKDNYLL